MLGIDQFYLSTNCSNILLKVAVKLSTTESHLNSSMIGLFDSNPPQLFTTTNTAADNPLGCK